MRPHQLAVECNGKTMTYTELDSCANQVASYLHRRGVQGNALVALCLKKSCALYAAMLGILKAGAGYVPIDPNFPVGRIQAVLADAGVAFVLSDSETQRVLDGNVPATVLDVGMILSGDPSLPAVSIIAPTDVCYVIYTSGSTGVPKGVVIEHRNAVHFVRAIRQVYGLNECDRTYQGFSIAFDASVEEIWAAFSNGGTLVVPTRRYLKVHHRCGRFHKRENYHLLFHGAIFPGHDGTRAADPKAVGARRRSMPAGIDRALGAARPAHP